MPSIDSDGEGDDIFFEACDDIKTSAQASSSIRCSTSDQASASWRGEYEIWTSEPMSIKERRHRFLIGMGFAEPVPTGITFSQWQGEITTDCAFCDLEVEERISSICSSYRSSFSSAPDSSYCIRDLDTGSRFIVHEIQHDGVAGILEEVGTDRLMIINQSEGFLKLSQLVQKFLRKGGPRSSAGASNTAFSAKKKDILCFCGRFTRKKGEARVPLYDVHMRSLKTGTFFRTKVDQQNKKWMDFSAVYMCQEIQAHGGSIRVMKFSTSGLHLATVGEDCIVRIWMIRVVESSPDQYGRETPAGYKDRSKSLKMKLGKGRNRALAIIPKKVFSILETPLHELHGHTSDILDMTWSKSDFLLTSSKDKTVRMWKVGCDSCLAVFEHRDYVTSVQFNPVDERYFISGSIDGKVRVWDASEKRVVDWDDTKDIITAVTYQPDGKGAIVGTVAGTCRFYDLSDGNMELKKAMRIKQNKVVTGLQFSAGDPSRIVVSSTDSKIRVSEGVGNGITQKFEGRRGSKALLPPSLTSDGQYIVSAGEDSNVYIWDFDATKDGKSSRRVRSCELFYSDGVTSVAPWPGPRHDGGSGGDGEVRWSERRPTLCRDRECCSFGTWFFADGLRGSATWPEEKLLPSLKYVNCAGMDDCRRKVSAAWNTVVVTGSRDGVIRCFHNYGLPVKL